ncbi:family 16 glycoside hydrolase [Telluribacter humicola]|uniref:family 16 glycoside hydrolase n=1 Tax=Telluribacter humicola TaxID=1720261 RepID=UPI001E3E8AA9|nr:family 16 glycoside hydrolase [Telluribacter humicola]
MKNLLVGLVLCTLVQWVAIPTASAQKRTELDLTQVLHSNNFKAQNRQATALTSESKKAIHLDAKPGAGIIWLNDVEFSNGEIEFDVRGKDVLQQSFPGIAFHGKDLEAYDAIYFRPFNFRADDPVRRSHSVQYISMPGYDWPKLRSEFPDKYEQPLANAPDPNGWFHVKVVVASPKVSVFVNGAEQPSLVVDKLSTRQTGSVGLWVGNNSEGDFANLTITPAAGQ